MRNDPIFFLEEDDGLAPPGEDEYREDGKKYLDAEVCCELLFNARKEKKGKKASGSVDTSHLIKTRNKLFWHYQHLGVQQGLDDRPFVEEQYFDGDIELPKKEK